MSEVRYIPAKPPKREMKVGIYCRVSSSGKEQLKSLAAQASGLTHLVASTPQWLLVDMYMDVGSAKADCVRREFLRMIEDCRIGKLDIVIAKSVSRFGRDTVMVLDAVRKIKEVGARVLFIKENLIQSILILNYTLVYLDV